VCSHILSPITQQNSVKCGIGGKVKGKKLKLSLCLTKYHTMETYILCN
jgi:hypothetical protein